MCGQLIICYYVPTGATRIDDDDDVNEVPVFDSWYTNVSSLLDCTLLRQLFVYKKNIYENVPVSKERKFVICGKKCKIDTNWSLAQPIMWLEQG